MPSGGRWWDHIYITSTQVNPVQGARNGRMEASWGRGGEEGVIANKNSKVEPTGNSEPKSVLKSLLSTSSKI